MKNILTIIVGLFIYFAIGTTFAIPEKGPTIASPKLEQPGSEKNPLFVKLAPEPSAVKREAKEEEYRKEKSAEDKHLTKYTFWLAAVTTLLAIFTGGLWWATYRLARDAKVSAQQQRSDMERSLAISERSVKTALRTVETMEQTAQKQLRAYLFLHGATIKNVEAGKQPEITIELRNSGATPAYDVRHMGAFFIARGPGDLVEFDIGGTSPVSITPLQMGPGAVVVQETPYGQVLNPLTIAALHDKKLTIYAYGKMTYKDIFGKSHWTTYRTMQGGDGADIGSNALTACPEGNDADYDLTE